MGRHKLPEWKKAKFEKISVRPETKKIIVEHAEAAGVPHYKWVHDAIIKSFMKNEKETKSRR